MEKKEAMEILKDFHDKSALFSVRTALETLIPELVKSEDERIKKDIIIVLEREATRCFKETGSMPQWYDRSIAWLEKQGEQPYWKPREEQLQTLHAQLNEGAVTYPEDKRILSTLYKDLIKIMTHDEKQDVQKPADKFEPKFNVGDWIISPGGCYLQILDIKKDGYLCKDIIGEEIKVLCEHSNCDFKLWTIQDAKDGDVLVCESGWTCIFKTLVNDETFSSYCFMDDTKWFCETGSECHTLKDEFVEAYNGKIQPATKEQRDLLFQKMKEAGYEWDAMKKELKKIEEEFNGEDYGIDSLYHAQTILEKTLGEVEGYQTDDGILEHKCAITAVKKLYEQKPTWSEEDEEMIAAVIADIQFTQKAHNHEVNQIVYEREIDWLKSLKDRILPQLNQVLSNDVTVNEYVDLGLHSGTL